MVTNAPLRLGLSAGLGALLGLVGAQVLFVDSGLSLVPWTVAGLLLGLMGRTRVEAAQVGAAYGFCLAFVFMLAGYSGDASLLSRVPFFVLLGLFGAVCGLILAVLGRAVLPALMRTFADSRQD